MLGSITLKDIVANEMVEPPARTLDRKLAPVADAGMPTAGKDNVLILPAGDTDRSEAETIEPQRDSTPVSHTVDEESTATELKAFSTAVDNVPSAHIAVEYTYDDVEGTQVCVTVAAVRIVDTVPGTPVKVTVRRVMGVGVAPVDKESTTYRSEDDAAMLTMVLNVAVDEEPSCDPEAGLTPAGPASVFTSPLLIVATRTRLPSSAIYRTVPSGLRAMELMVPNLAAPPSPLLKPADEGMPTKTEIVVGGVLPVRSNDWTPLEAMLLTKYSVVNDAAVLLLYK